MPETQTEGAGAVLERTSTRRAELLTFLALAFGVWPFVAVGFVGAYGLMVWIYQMIFGPPGPPGTLH